MVQTIDRFKGKYFFLSNFHPCRVKFEDNTYRSVEHAYQAAKTYDLSIRKDIQKLIHPRDAKQFGNKILYLRTNWEDVKLKIMYELVWEKFQEPFMTELLLSTHDAELIEGNWWGDTFWGICRGKGENHLGKILMCVRDELRS